jgi:cytochrome P450
MIPLFGKGIFTSDGQMWSHSRALLRPSFARHNMTSHLPFMEAHFEELMKAIPKDGSTVDLQKLFFGFTMDTATEFLFGHSVNTLSNMQEAKSQTTNPSEISDADFVSSYTYACLDAVHNIRLGALSKLRYNPLAIRAQKRAHAYIDRFVDEALELRNSNSTKLDTASQYIFLNELAKETDNRPVLRDQILSVLLAGRDTTASLLSNMFFELARNPVIYEKLRNEVAGLKGEPPTYEELKDLKYLRYCINECSSPLPSLSQILTSPSPKHSASVLSYQPTPAKQSATPFYHSAEEQTANLQCSSRKVHMCIIVSIPCTVVKSFSVQTLRNTDQKDGRRFVQDGYLFSLSS